MYDKFLKRVIDIIFVLILLFPLLVISVFIAIAIKIDSKGPIIFKQKRLGKNGKEFNIFKYRTMIDNAEKVGSGLITFEGDNRITKVGSILRKTSLDELPQILNVLKGDMSLVGPRPPVPYHPREYHEYTKVQKKRFIVRPGITGFAQVKGRNSLSWDERIKLDLEYIKKQNILLDFTIILLTVVKVFKRDGIHGNKSKSDVERKVKKKVSNN
ncbi:sugar transferase [Pseudogracilibacillus sp. SE30717A]|uniref:sugar transferase n=1 Tax=Pseudogracilibacillus sp. SE30717A TaxID=3098293 RepID=UPI00300DC7DB